jgi:hypothetical protein
MSRARNSGPRLEPSKVIWPTIYGLILLAVAAHVLFLIGAAP